MHAKTSSYSSIGPELCVSEAFACGAIKNANVTAIFGLLLIITMERLKPVPLNLRTLSALQLFFYLLTYFE